MRKVVRSALVLASVLLIAACPRSIQLPGGALPAAPPPGLASQDATVYVISAEASEVHVEVYRGGAMARLGHNHVMTSKSLSGRAWMHPTFAKSGFELSFPVDQLIVDDPRARRAAGDAFQGEVPESDREGTRKNMLRAEQLDAQRYPDITLRAARVAGTPHAAQITARITIRGVSRDVELPASISVEGARLTARGEFDIRQTDFEIKPFSIVLGALQVQDRLHIRFKVVGVRRTE